MFETSGVGRPRGELDRRARRAVGKAREGGSGAPGRQWPLLGGSLVPAASWGSALRGCHAAMSQLRAAASLTYWGREGRRAVSGAGPAPDACLPARPPALRPVLRPQWAPAAQLPHALRSPARRRPSCPQNLAPANPAPPPILRPRQHAAVLGDVGRCFCFKVSLTALSEASVVTLISRQHDTGAHASPCTHPGARCAWGSCPSCMLLGRGSCSIISY